MFQVSIFAFSKAEVIIAQKVNHACLPHPNRTIVSLAFTCFYDDRAVLQFSSGSPRRDW